MGQTLSQPATVRMDPRVTASDADMREWYRHATTIERTECTLNRAAGELAGLEQQLSTVQSSPDARAREQAAALARDLRPVILALRGDPRDPGHVNLPGRLNWLTIQVGNYSGRPTAVQIEWINTYAQQAEDVLKSLEGVKRRLAER
jgi:hypothetical protein